MARRIVYDMQFNMDARKWKKSGLIGWYLLLSLAACDAPVSEKAPGPAQSASKAGTAAVEEVTDAVQRGSDQNDRRAVSTKPVTDSDERDNRSIPGVPDTVIKELGSADPRERYRALDHWEKQDSKAPLDPVFEAMEDEDEAVRAKATTIVEQYWAAEQKREKG